MTIAKPPFREPFYLTPHDAEIGNLNIKWATFIDMIRKGSSIIYKDQSTTNPVRSVTDRLNDEPISVLDFMTVAQRANVRARLATIDVTVAFQAAIDALPSNGGTVFAPAGAYLLQTLNFPNNPKVVNLVGSGMGATVFQMATAAGPLIKKVSSAGRIIGALFSDFTIKAHASSDKTNLAHKGMLLTGWSNSHFKRIEYQSYAAGSGGLGVFIDLAAHPYLCYQNTFEGIKASVQYGPSRVIYMNNNGQTVSENPNIEEIRDSWFYGLTGCDVIIAAPDCTCVSIRNNIFEDCAGATGVIMGQSTLVEGNWFELLESNITTESFKSTDGSSSVISKNYFSGTGSYTSIFIDTITHRPLFIGNSGFGASDSEITGQGVIRIDATAIKTYDLYPFANDTYYLGKNSTATPLAWKGLIVKDTTSGDYYRIEVISGTLTATHIPEESASLSPSPSSSESPSISASESPSPSPSESPSVSPSP